MKKTIIASIIFLALTIFPYEGYSQTSTILPDSCIGDWGNAGVEGGIPNYPQGVNVLDYGATGDGTTNDLAAILAAIEACEEEHAVYFPAGTYNISGTIKITESVVLRGDGPDLTHIIQTSTSTTISIETGGDWAGIEDLHVHTNYDFDGNSGNHINLFSVQNSWVKNIETSGFVGNNVRLMNCSHCEVRDSYIHNSYEEVVEGDGTGAYGIILFGAEQGADGGSGSCVSNLVENNVVDWMRHALILLKNCSHNVYAYNFCWNNWSNTQSETHCFKLHHPDYVDTTRIVTYTLGEGNACEMIGSSDRHRNNTFFRNRAMGGNLPGISVVPYMYAIGNELPEKKYSWAPNNVIGGLWKDNYIAHGNYVTDDGSGLQWDASISDHNIPNSYYLNEKPNWFGDLDWPCYGGDLMPGNKRRSPAEVRYWTMHYPEESPSDLQGDIQSDSVVLTWDNNSTNTVDFIICRSTDNIKYYRIGETFQTTYTDTIQSLGQYYYYVRARNHLGGVNGDDLGGESDPSNILSIHDGVVSIEQSHIVNNAISVYPNPAKDVIYFNMKEDQAQTISIYNSLGQLVLQEKYTKNSIKTGNLDKGVYFLVIKGDRKNFYANFIIE